MKKNNKGFTLAEMLIVVAIIGVLIAILIPTFTAQLTKAKVATTQANLRSAYAEAVANYLAGEGSTTIEFHAETSLNATQFSAVAGVSGTNPITAAGAYTVTSAGAVAKK